MKQYLPLLRRIKDRLSPSMIMHAVYISPAQQLRNQADEIEQQQRDAIELNELIELLEQVKENK